MRTIERRETPPKIFRQALPETPWWQALPKDQPIAVIIKANSLFPNIPPDTDPNVQAVRDVLGYIRENPDIFQGIEQSAINSTETLGFSFMSLTPLQCDYLMKSGLATAIIENPITTMELTR